jgi:hypothetical protein
MDFQFLLAFRGAARWLLCSSIGAGASGRRENVSTDVAVGAVGLE